MYLKFTKVIRNLTIATALIGITSTAISAQDIRIGAMREGSAWYIFAATLEQIIEPILGANSVEVIARGGGVANPLVVQAGNAEIALSNVASAVWAYEGADVYDGRSAPDIRALVGGLNSVYVGVIARQDFLDSRGTTDLEQLLTSTDPIRVLMKPVGSSAVPVAAMIFESVGTSADEIRANGGDIIQVGAGQIADQMRNNNADIYIDTMLRGHPTITEVALTVPVQFLDLPDGMEAVAADNGLTIGSYGPWFEGQGDAGTIGANLGTVLIASTALDDETAYLITKALIENAEALKNSHGAWSRFDPSQAWTVINTGIPLHAGAERYYREIGLIE
ncbi:MAG: TAXI family TRAP transporter solute-binding subunit [Rhodobacteraceae bacterium]|nr:TAXI family TRAP transporter solute-binding subunit [Paracoccaceae bacterium]PHR56238.1 MAG: TRAP transporter substrate-binding protein [Robiginitomaculum sp.]